MHPSVTECKIGCASSIRGLHIKDSSQLDENRPSHLRGICSQDQVSGYWILISDLGILHPGDFLKFRYPNVLNQSGPEGNDCRLDAVIHCKLVHNPPDVGFYGIRAEIEGGRNFRIAASFHHQLQHF